MDRKHVLLLALCAALLFGLLTGCAQAENDNPKADAYLEMAQEFLDNDNPDAAMDILKKGFEETKDDRLAVMIAELVSDAADHTEPSSAPTSDYTDYAGEWKTEGSGGLTMSLSVNDGTMHAQLSCVSAYPACRVALTELDIPLEGVGNNSVEAVFDDDGWGNSGTIVLTFGDESILCEIKNIQWADPAPLWGFFNGKYPLVRYHEPEHILTSENQQEINAFLSIFSQHWLREFPTDDYALVEFARNYIQLNVPALIQRSGNYAIVTQSDLDGLLTRFLDTTADPAHSSMKYGELLQYRDGSYYFWDAIGEYYGNIVIAHDMTDNGDGTYTVLFNIYGTPFLSEPSNYYNLTDTEASQAQDLNYVSTGSAVIRDYTEPDGTKTYQLVRYQTLGP